MRNSKATVPWESEDGESFAVECSVAPGSPGRGPDLNGPGEPPEGPEVEVIAVRDEHGVERPDLIPLVEADWDVIEERALIEVEEAEIAAWDAEQDRRCDEARDARMLGEHW
jgi:hypothetical protein